MTGDNVPFHPSYGDLSQADLKNLVGAFNEIGKVLQLAKCGVLNVNTPFGTFHFVPPTMKNYCSLLMRNDVDGVPRMCAKPAKYRINTKGTHIFVCVDHMPAAIEDVPPDEILNLETQKIVYTKPVDKDGKTGDEAGEKPVHNSKQGTSVEM